MNNIISGYEKVISIMPKGWEEKAREYKAFTRGRKIKSEADLLKMILLHLTAGGSFGSTSAILRLGEGYEMNKNAVYERFCKSGEWLAWLCSNFCKKAGLITEKPEWLEGKRICLVDATDEAVKGNRNNIYRLHYMMELFTLDTLEMQLTKNTQGETLTNFNNIQAGDIVIGDRAYGTIKGFGHVLNSEADYVLRIKGSYLSLYNEKGEKINLIEEIGEVKERENKSFDLFFRSESGMKPVRICVRKKTAEEQEKTIRQIKKSNSSEYRGVVSSCQNEYSHYIIIATSLKEPCEKIMELYRLRWQIELVFKRFKSIFNYDEMPAKKDKTIRAWFYGKLLVAAICEALVNEGRFSPERQECLKTSEPLD